MREEAAAKFVEVNGKGFKKVDREAILDHVLPKVRPYGG